MKRILTLLMALVMALSVSTTALAADTGFLDIPADTDCAQAVSWCQENNILNGVGGNRFDPNGTLTRAMLATALYRAAGEPAVSGAPAFSDALPGAWYSNAVAWADENGFARGYGNGLFGPDDPASVEQMAVILDRYLGKGDTWVGDPARAHAATRAQIAVALYDALAEGNGDTTSEGGKVLVVYFSATGSTAHAAGYLADKLDADLFELIPQAPYSSADLDWTASDSRVNKEHDNEALRDVQLAKDTVENWDAYNTVFLGYPIWWGNAAWPVNDFVKSNNFSGKTVIPFCTSASSGLGQSGELLKEMAGTGRWLEGHRFSSGSGQTDVEQWVDTLDLPALP